MKRGRNRPAPSRSSQSSNKDGWSPELRALLHIGKCDRRERERLLSVTSTLELVGFQLAVDGDRRIQAVAWEGDPISHNIKALHFLGENTKWKVKGVAS